MHYNSLVEELFFNTQHEGKLEQGPDVVCGAIDLAKTKSIHLYLAFDKQGNILKTAFKVSGNPYLVAGLEWLCRKLEGRNMIAVPTLDYQLIMQELAIPKNSYPTALLIVEIGKETLKLMKMKLECPNE